MTKLRIDVLGVLRISGDETRVAAYAGLAAATRDPASLIGDLILLAAEYPYRESVQELLLRVLYRSGDAALALDAYHRFRRALGEEMGVEPGSRLRRVYEAILREEPLVANV